MMKNHNPHNPAGRHIVTPSDAACGCDDYEKKFRRQNLFHSFMAAVYSTIGAAVGFGVLNNVVSLLLPHAATAGATALASTAAGTGSVAAAGFFAAISPYLAMAALVVVGVAAIYMAQREYTTLNCIQGERQARINAEALQPKHTSRTLTITHEHDSDERHAHARSDGRNWTEATQPSMAAERAM